MYFFVIKKRIGRRHKTRWSTVPPRPLLLGSEYGPIVTTDVDSKFTPLYGVEPPKPNLKTAVYTVIYQVKQDFLAVAERVSERVRKFMRLFYRR